MKHLSWKWSLAVMCGALGWLGPAAPAVAADDNPGGQAERLERLEHRLNELAQHQEQLMRRLGAQQEWQAPMGAPGREGFRPSIAAPPGAGAGLPVPPVMAPVPPPTPAPAAQPVCPMKCCKDVAGLIKLCLLVAFIFNILLAIWIFTDIRKRGEGSGLFIALALLAGIPAAIIYSLVRIGDKKP